MQSTFFEEQPDIDWLFMTHLSAWMGTDLHNGAVCAVVFGNEDSPERVEIYQENHYQSIPDVFIQDTNTGNLIPESK